MVRRTKYVRVPATLVGALIVLTGAASSEARSNQQPVTVLGHSDALTRVVSFSDLPLATREGQRTLERRVSYAVGEVCPDGTKIGSWYDVDDCKAFAWRGAHAQMRAAVGLARTGQLVAMSIVVSAAS